MKRITDKDFKYVPAAATDVGATIRREQKRLKALADEAAADAERNAKEAAAKVAPMKKARAA